MPQARGTDTTRASCRFRVKAVARPHALQVLAQDDVRVRPLRLGRRPLGGRNAAVSSSTRLVRVFVRTGSDRERVDFIAVGRASLGVGTR
jgi:hypothetical protein